MRGAEGGGLKFYFFFFKGKQTPSFHYVSQHILKKYLAEFLIFLYLAGEPTSGKRKRSLTR